MTGAHDVDSTAKLAATPRVVDDAHSLRALTHPVRLALLDALLAGPLTATQAGDAIGESATTCSFHLRQLAKYGFVEEAGGGKGRNRPWRRTDNSLAIPVRPGDSAFSDAAQAVHGVMLDRYFQQLRTLLEDFDRLPAQWQTAVAGSETIIYVNAAEAKQISDEYDAWLDTLADRWGNRIDNAAGRPADAQAVQLLFFSTPVAHTMRRHVEGQPT